MHEIKKHNSDHTQENNPSFDFNLFDKDDISFKQKYDVLFQTITDGVGLIKNGQIIYSNTALAIILGYSIDEIFKLSLKEILSPNAVEFVLDRYEKRNRGENVPTNYETELIDKTKTRIIPVALSVGRLPSIKDNYEFVIVRDLTERVEIENRVKRETELHNYFMDYLPDSIYFKDLESKFIKANNATAQKFGLKSSVDLIGKSDFDFFSQEHATQAKNDESKIIKDNRSLINSIEKEIWPDGKITWASTTKIPLIDENEKVYGTFGITRDITQLKNAQDINEALFKISTAVTTLKNIDELYSSIHKSISDLMRTDNFYIAIYHPETDTVSFPYFVDEVDTIPQERKAARGLTEYVLRTGKAQLIDSKLDLELRTIGETSLIGEQTQIWLGVPLTVEEKTIGVLVDVAQDPMW